MQLDLDDTKWQQLDGAYRIPYDASIPLKSLRDGIDVWDELWSELHHQGDVDVASYAAVPQLVRVADRAASRDWNFYGLLSTIEVERHRKRNPLIPEWLAESYQAAWNDAAAMAMRDLPLSEDASTTQAILSVLALSKGDVKLGALLSGLDASELDHWLEARVAWSELYR